MRKPYVETADTFSFAMVMWELLTGCDITSANNSTVSTEGSFLYAEGCFNSVEIDETSAYHCTKDMPFLYSVIIPPLCVNVLFRCM